jgi:phage-related protein
VSESIGLILLPLVAKLSQVLLKLADFAQQNSKVIVILGGVIAGLAVAVLAANAAMKVYQATLLIVKAAQFALNAVMAANPITLVVLAIAALVAAFVIAYKTSETFRNFINNLFSAIKTGVTQSVEFLKNYLNGVLGVYKAIFNTIIGGVQSVLNLIGKLVGAIRSIPSLPNIGGAVGGLIGKIPGLAKGGIVTRPTLAMVGEAGPEAVIPLNRMNSGGGVTVNVMGGLATSAEIGQAVVNAIRAYNRSAGPANIQVA